MKNYKCILFDWDGTLTQTLSIWRNALLYSLDLHGHSLSPDMVTANYAQFADIASDSTSMSAAEIKSVIKTARERIRDTEDLAETYDGTAVMLRSIHEANKKIAIVTTSTHRQVDRSLQKWHIDHMIDVVVCGEDVDTQKPSAEPLELAMQLLNAKPFETIMVGDSPSDLVAAKNAHIDSMLYFPPGHEVFYDLAKLKALAPTYIAHSSAELILKLT